MTLVQIETHVIALRVSTTCAAVPVEEEARRVNISVSTAVANGRPFAKLATATVL